MYPQALCLFFQLFGVCHIQVQYLKVEIRCSPVASERILHQVGNPIGLRFAAEPSCQPAQYTLGYGVIQESKWYAMKVDGQYTFFLLFVLPTNGKLA